MIVINFLSFCFNCLTITLLLYVDKFIFTKFYMCDDYNQIIGSFFVGLITLILTALFIKRLFTNG